MANEQGKVYVDNLCFQPRIVMHSCITNKYALEIRLGNLVNEGENPVQPV